jgi:hypothetical protein
MAVADSALFGIESLDDLQKLEIPPGEEELILSFKESALDRPILRKCTKEKGTTEEKMPKKINYLNLEREEAPRRWAVSIIMKK